MKQVIISALALLAVLSAQAEGTLREQLLQSIEDNNLTLKAERELMGARTAEARSGNNLPDPSVTYDYLWGKPSAAGNSGELNVVQGFDFPTAYAARSRHIEALGKQYANQYDALRQQVLLQAEQALIELASLRAKGELLDEMVANARRLSELYAKKLAAGDATALERNKVDIELMNALNAMNMNKIDIEAAVARLEALNGGVPLPQLQGDLTTPLPGLPGLDEVTRLYEEGDAGVAAMRTAADAASRQVGVARNEGLPKLEVGFRRETALGESFNGVKMGMTIPIFENNNKVKRARAEQQVAQTQLRESLSQQQISLRRLHAKASLLLGSYESHCVTISPGRCGELANKALEAGQINIEDYFVEISSIILLRETQLAIERDYRMAVAELLMPAL